MEQRELLSGSLPSVEVAEAALHAAAHMEAVAIYSAMRSGGNAAAGGYDAASGAAKPAIARRVTPVNFAGGGGLFTSPPSAAGAFATERFAPPAAGAYTCSVQGDGSVLLSIGCSGRIAPGAAGRAGRPAAMVTPATGGGPCPAPAAPADGDRGRTGQVWAAGVAASVPVALTTVEECGRRPPPSPLQGPGVIRRRPPPDSEPRPARFRRLVRGGFRSLRPRLRRLLGGLLSHARRGRARVRAAVGLGLGTAD